jgi:Fe-S cluster assembly protein SufB
MVNEQDRILSEVTGGEYKYGFYTDIETETIPKGLNEEIVRMISAKKGEPEWMLEFRLKAFRHWQTLEMPQWAHLQIPESTTRTLFTMLPLSKRCSWKA